MLRCAGSSRKTAHRGIVAAHLGVAANYRRHRYIVQSGSAEAARDAVLLAGGIVTGDLSVIRAVAASLDEHEMAALRAEHVAQLYVFNDTAVAASSLGALPETYYPAKWLPPICMSAG